MNTRLAATAGALAFLAALSLRPSMAAEQSGTLTFVVRDWFTAMYESRFMDECPEGLNIGNDEYWWRGLSKKDRARLTEDGLVQTLNRHNLAVARGPKGEDVCLIPTLVKDPPLRVVEGKLAYGDNLDGTTDGRATAKTCKHTKFTTPDGKAGIDNQLYRLVGCTYGWRKGGLVDLNANEMRGTSGLGMILIEITGVDNPRNDDDVTVTFYRSIDQFALDSAGTPLPFSTYRIETVDGKPRYADSVKGKIVNGVLETGRGDVRLPFYGNYNFINPVIKDLGLKLEIAEDGRTATGMVTGYYDVESFMHYVSGLGVAIVISYFSCNAMYEAAQKLADGYPDPKTGACTMLSSAFKINAFAAFALHPEKQSRQAAR